LSDFSLDLHQSLADREFAKSLDRSIGMPVFFANPPPSRSQHISSGKIAQLRYEKACFQMQQGDALMAKEKYAEACCRLR
jgi:hypothetical protein